MRGRRGAENGELFASVDLPAGTAIEVPAAVSGQDRLEYIADMVQQLKIMSAQADCQVLADLLECAYREAMRQAGIRT
jgi:hypothetical protein